MLLCSCNATPEEMQQLNMQMQQLNHASQGWAQSAQQMQQYTAPQAMYPGQPSGGVTYRQVGDAIIGSNGVTYRQAGSSIVGSDGTVCQVVSQQLICR